MVKNLPEIQKTQVQSLGQEDPLEKGMATTPVFLPREFHGQKSLVGHSPWGHKELDMSEHAQPHLTKGKTVSSVRNLIMVAWIEG